MVNDTSPVFRFAEKFPDIPKTQLTQSSKGEYLPIGFAQVMEKPVDAHMLILPHNRFLRTGGWIGKMHGIVDQLIFSLSLLGQP